MRCVPAGCQPLIFAALLVSTALSAEPATDPLRLPDLQVTAPEGHWRAVSPSVSEVDDAVQGARGLSLDQALAGMPGVFAQNEANFAQGLRISIRGFGSRAAFGVRGIRVLVDGVPLTLPDGQTELDALDLGLVERVSVSRGAASAQFGNAAGGVLAIQTREPGEETAGAAELMFGAHGVRRLRVEAEGGAFSTRGLAAFSGTRVDGRRPHADFHSDLLNLKATHEMLGGQLNAGFSALWVDAQDPGALNAAQRAADRFQAAPNNLRFDAGESIAQQRLSAQWSSNDTGVGTTAISAYLGQRRFDNRLPFRNGGQVEFERGFGGLSLATDGEWQLFGRQHLLNAGLDLQWQDDQRARYDNLDGQRGDLSLDQAETADGAGLWLQYALALGERWAVQASLRQDLLRLAVRDRFLVDGDDSGRRRFDDLSASAGLSWQATARQQWHLRLATAYESPTATELANPSGGGFNPALQAARSLSSEVGVSGELSVLRYQLVAYRIELDDELLPFEVSSQPGRSFFRNAGESRRDGAELAVSAEPLNGWTLGAAITLGSYRFRNYVVDGQDFAGNQLPGVPARYARLHAAYQRGTWHARLAHELIGDQRADDANSVRVAGYGLLHLSLGQALRLGARSIDWQLGFRNLLDRDYNDNVRINAFGGRHFEAAEGRAVYASLGAAF